MANLETGDQLEEFWTIQVRDDQILSCSVGMGMEMEKSRRI